jgi:caffeoyl-CoA O-methyltransferase
MDVTDPSVERYIEGLLAVRDDPVLLEMEAEAERTGFPIVGRMSGAIIEIVARSIGATRVFELGSGYGYSAYWFARATGPEGEIHLTDRDPENERKAMDYLGRAGVAGSIRYHLGDAIESLRATEGEFDVIYCDIDKGAYPDAWAAARERIRPGGLYVCDNTLGWGSGNVATGEGREDWIQAVRRHNQAVFADEGFVATILPIRDGVLVASRAA